MTMFPADCVEVCKPSSRTLAELPVLSRVSADQSRRTRQLQSAPRDRNSYDRNSYYERSRKIAAIATITIRSTPTMYLFAASQDCEGFIPALNTNSGEATSAAATVSGTAGRESAGRVVFDSVSAGPTANGIGA